MAYGAVGSLELTIERLLKSSHVSIVQNSSPQIINLLYDEILSLKEALREFDRKRSTVNMKMVKSLEAQIIDVVYQFEDVIDPHLSNQFHSQSVEEEADHHPSMLYSIDLLEIKQDVDSYIETVSKMKTAYIHELHNPSPEEEEEGEEEGGEDEEDDDVGGNDHANLVGFSDLFMRVKDRLNSSQSEGMVVSLAGMAGIGKTALALKLFHDPSIVSRYSKRVFVTVGPKYRLYDICVDILWQLHPEIDEVPFVETDESFAIFKWFMFKTLENWRYLIVLDDVWDKELCFELFTYFPDYNNGSQILLTTRLREVAGNCAHPLNAFDIRLLDKKECWELFREKVFGDQQESSSFSYEFAKAGKKIAENCEGLPLTIVTVANILSKAEMTLEYWNKVADDKRHSVYKDAYDEMSNVLYPSYDYLDQHFKACFLYVGVFPQNYWVGGYDLSKLCSAEGFLNSKPMHYLDTATTSLNTYGYLDELVEKNVIMYDVEATTYGIQSSFWYLCNKEAAKNKLFYALNSCADALLEEGISCQRRLCIRNSILIAIEDVRDSIASASTVRSILFTGDLHEYPIPLCLEHLRLLKVLNSLCIRFYEFPMEVLKLVQLRCLALTYDGSLPTCISKLWNLQQLIVGQYCFVSYVGNVSYLPIEIWNMKELTYIRIMRRDLPHPCHEGSLLPNLFQLIGAGPQTCTKDVLLRIPNLKELSIRIDLPPDGTEPLSCFDHISHLHQLQVLECRIVNPMLKTEVVSPLTPLSDFPSSLATLILSGLGYPWEEMSKISSLPNLRSMTLECYAFRGPEWQVHLQEFPKLEYLCIEDTDVVQWKSVTTNSCLPAIKWVFVKHCYKLKEIPMTFGTTLQSIRVVDCNPTAVNCATMLKKEWDDKYGDGKRSLDLYVHSSL